MGKIKVVIADDVNVIAEQHRKVASSFSEIDVIGIAKNGQEEYEMIVNLQPDLVITDNQMPEKNGIDVIELVNNSSIAHKPQFILVTGDSGAEFNKKAYDLGVFKVISKISYESQLKYAIDDFLYLQSTNESDIIEKHQEKEENTEGKSIFKKLFKKR